jgi:hypothetical protein
MRAGTMYNGKFHCLLPCQHNLGHQQASFDLVTTGACGRVGSPGSTTGHALRSAVAASAGGCGYHGSGPGRLASCWPAMIRRCPAFLQRRTPQPAPLHHSAGPDTAQRGAGDGLTGHPGRTCRCSPGIAYRQEGWPGLADQGVPWSSSTRLTVAAIFW